MANKNKQASTGKTSKVAVSGTPTRLRARRKRVSILEAHPGTPGQRHQRPLKAGPYIAGPRSITYRAAPKDAAEHSRRWSEQRALAELRGKEWDALTETEKLRRTRFGSKAYCRRLRDVRDLATLNARIAHERELVALQRKPLTLSDLAWFSETVGFSRPTRLAASNKLVRVETSYELARAMVHLFRAGGKRFFWITLINDGWHSSLIRTVFRLSEIHRKINHCLHSLGLDCFGMVEADIFNNWCFGRNGLRVAPHVHMLCWTDNKSETTASILGRFDTRELRSDLGLSVVDVKPVRSTRRLVHLCYYMSKPNHLAKSLGRWDANKGRRRVYSVEKSVRPSHTLRLAEILSYVEISDLMVSSWAGHRIRRRLVRRLRRRCLEPSEARGAAPQGLSAKWRAIKSTARSSRSFVEVC